MSVSTWITMIGIIAFVWGGCVFAIATAVRKESVKNKTDSYFTIDSSSPSENGS